MTIRRNLFIRSVASVTGDFAVGLGLAVACSWIIQAASLGLFLSFLLWLIALVLGLALSQYAMHPAVQFVLSDRKLDQGTDALVSAGQALADLGVDLRAPAWGPLRRQFGRIADRCARRFTTRFTAP
jgi:ABC-type sugar transport system permease subunit